MFRDALCNCQLSIWDDAVGLCGDEGRTLTKDLAMKHFGVHERLSTGMGMGNFHFVFSSGRWRRSCGHSYAHLGPNKLKPSSPTILNAISCTVLNARRAVTI